MPAEPDRIATNLRTLLIVEALAAAARPLTPTELNERVGLPKQSLHRLCNTLVREGFLVRDVDGRRLLPSARLRGMAAGLQAVSGLDIERHQILVSIAAQVGETVNFVVPEQQGMIYRDRVETDWPFRVQLPVGTHVPFHCTASGKTWLASLAPARRAAVVNTLALQRHTAHTLTDGRRLLAELVEVARRGYALDDQEFVEQMVAIAVPVTDARGRYLAAVAFHGPLSRLTLDRAVAQVDVLREGARALSALLCGE